MTTVSLPAFAKGLCDDAAIFPPGLAPLAEAVPAHVRHVNAPYAELVGPLVVSTAALEELAGLVPVDGGDRLGPGPYLNRCGRERAHRRLLMSTPPGGHHGSHRFA